MQVVLIVAGLVIQTLLFVGALVGVYVAIERRLTALETKIEPMWRVLDRRGVRATTGRTDA